MDSLVQPCVDIAVSWVKSGAKWIRYEELLTETWNCSTEALLVDCGLPIKKEHSGSCGIILPLRKILRRQKARPGRYQFPCPQRCRRRLEKPIHAQNQSDFKERFGEALKICGYEKDHDW